MVVVLKVTCVFILCEGSAVYSSERSGFIHLFNIISYLILLVLRERRLENRSKY